MPGAWHTDLRLESDRGSTPACTAMPGGVPSGGGGACRGPPACRGRIMKTIRTVLVVALIVAFPAAVARSLERAEARLDADHEPWIGSGTTTIRYYNLCTGWMWTLSGLVSSARFGLVVDAPPSAGVLSSTWLFAEYGAPAAWGFTGSVDVRVVDASGCLAGIPLQSQPYLPVTGWAHLAWDLPVPARFALVATACARNLPPWGLVLDHPAAGPDGATACGSCYPASRVNRSFLWGRATAPLCPPRTLLFDGVCDAQLVWDLSFAAVDDLEPLTWGRIKALYR